MTKKPIKFFGLGVVLFISACASTADIDFSKADNACLQQCNKGYSDCMTPFTFFPIQTQHQCTDVLRVCVKTCPVK